VIHDPLLGSAESRVTEDLVKDQFRRDCKGIGGLGGQGGCGFNWGLERARAPPVRANAIVSEGDLAAGMGALARRWTLVSLK